MRRTVVNVLVLVLYSSLLFGLGMWTENRRFSKNFNWPKAHVMCYVYDSIHRHGSAAAIHTDITVKRPHEYYNLVLWFQDGTVGQVWWDSNYNAVASFESEPRELDSKGRYEKDTRLEYKERRL